MADIRELFLNPVKDQGTCEVCKKNPTNMQCAVCKPNHYICKECEERHRRDVFGQ